MILLGIILKTIPLLIGNDVDNNIISSSATIPPVKGNEACYISRATKNGKIVNSLTWHWERCKGDFYRLFSKSFKLTFRQGYVFIPVMLYS